MIKNNPCLYCQKCKKFPKTIYEEYRHFYETRKWDGENYSLTDSGIENAYQRSVCPKCNSTLIRFHSIKKEK